MIKNQIIKTMDFEGVVYKIMPPTSGTSARGDWKRQEVIFELPQEFSRKICVTFFNKDNDVQQLREGMTCIVSVNIESREYNGRWYTDVRAWRVQPKQAEAAAPAQDYAAPATPFAPPTEEPASAYKANAEDVDDLPF